MTEWESRDCPELDPTRRERVLLWLTVAAVLAAVWLMAAPWGR